MSDLDHGIVFHQLGAKFLERREDIPENSKQIVYYSLAIGHHIGVFDCFHQKLRCSRQVFDRVLAALPEDGAARRKLGGIHKFGEITVDVTHTRMLKAAIGEILPAADAEMAEWLTGLRACLCDIEREPAIYLMGRKHLP